MAEYRKAKEIRENLLNADRGNFRLRRDLSVSLYKIGEVLEAQGKWNEALSTFREAMALAESLSQNGSGHTK